MCNILLLTANSLNNDDKDLIFNDDCSLNCIGIEWMHLVTQPFNERCYVQGYDVKK